ncbi:MAG: hypothetical protein FJ161_03920 [Gammaproteobacteria bacterium]|nr:hypothetical protein [Gammaproteobacteria bacterium]
MRVLDINFVIYCEHVASLPKVYELVTIYAPYFANTLILLNVPSRTTLPILYPEHMSSIRVLQMPDRLSTGAALNKMFAHLFGGKIFLIDSRSILKKEILQYLENSLLWNFELTETIVSFQSQPRYEQLHSANRIGNNWNTDFQFVTTLCWGALLFDQQFVIEIGAFAHCLSEDALTVDLSWRAQKSIGILLQSIESVVTLDDYYAPVRSEWSFLRKHYPDLYPDWMHFMRRSYQWVITSLPTMDTSIQSSKDLSATSTELSLN